jgi:transposase
MWFASVQKDGAMRRVEVVSGPERRRRWSEEQKRAIVAEASAPDASVRSVAQRLDVAPRQIYRWRRELSSAGIGFAEVEVSPSAHERREAKVPAIEIEVGSGIRIRIPTTTSRELACAVIKAVVLR